WLFYIALAAGIITFIVWISIGATIDTAIMRLVTVLVIACPHALGLGTPLVISVSTSLAAKHGLLIRQSPQFEKARKINAVIFDKNSTLTDRAFGVTDIQTFNNIDENTLLRYAATVEKDSEHPIAKGILNEAKLKELELLEMTNFNSITGVGIEGVIRSEERRVGKESRAR